MAIGIPNNCPICWDSYEICKCTEEDRRKYEEHIEELHKEAREKERKYFHKLLDSSFNNYNKRRDKYSIFDSSSFTLYLAKQIFKELKRGEWLELRKAFDKFFQVNGK